MEYGAENARLIAAANNWWPKVLPLFSVAHFIHHRRPDLFQHDAAGPRRDWYMLVAAMKEDGVNIWGDGSTLKETISNVSIVTVC